MRCGNRYGEKLPECPTCYLRNFELAPWIPEEIKQEYLDKWKIKKTVVTDNLIKTIFQKILEKYNIVPKRLKIKSGTTGMCEIRIFDKAKTNLELVYEPVVLSYFDEDEIEAMLYHEAHHVLTKNTTDDVMVPDVSPELQDYLSDWTVAYDEYRNYAEHLDYYKTSKPFLMFKRKEIANYGVMIADLKYMFAIDSLPTPLHPHNILLKMFLDAVYFMLLDREVFASWATKYSMNAILKFYEWITEDLKYIQGVNPTLEEIFTFTQLSGAMSISVDSSELVLGNSMGFTPDASSFYKVHYDRNNNLNQRKLIQSWIDRFNLTYQ